ncbi:MAG: hypothetical protein WCQ26_07820 [Pseudanabaena sp. ELA748]
MDTMNPTKNFSGSTSMKTRLSAIDFTTDIARLTENFTGRQWFFDEIDHRLEESEE